MKKKEWFFMRWMKVIRLLWRKIRGNPLKFVFLDEPKGISVGNPLSVVHPSFHDMAGYFCRCRLTDEVMLNGLDANAILVLSSERPEGMEHAVKTVFQPYKV